MKPRSFQAILAELGTDKTTSKRIRSGRMTADEIADFFTRNRWGAEKVATQAASQSKASAPSLPSSAESAVSAPTPTTREARIQAYIESGMTQEHAQYAADVLERAVNGEDLTNADIRKLRLATKAGANMLSEAFGMEIEQAKNNKEDANRVYREAEFAYRTARNAERYGDVEFDVRALPATQESADAVLANPKAKADLSALLGDTYSGNYKQQSEQIIRTLRNWWLGAYKTYTPKSVRMQVVDWREAHPQNAQLNIDNAAETQYTETNGGVLNGLAGSELHGASGEGVRGSSEGYDRHMSAGWSHGRGNLLHIRERRSVTVSSGGVVTTEVLSPQDSAAFSYFLNTARSEDKRNGWAVTPKTAEELADHEMIMASNGSAGAAVASDGDIQAVFRNVNTGVKGSMEAIIPRVLELGGTKLDCYGSDLVRIYERYGFIPVARVAFNEAYANEGWDASKGTPYIYFMIHNGDSAETVAANIGKYEHMTLEQLNALPTYGKEGYDEAAQYRDSVLERQRGGAANAQAAATVQQNAGNAAPVQRQRVEKPFSAR